MKKLIVAALATATLAMATSTVQAREAGGLAGGVVGCCFGVRTAAAWNEGKNLDIREWLRVVPFVGIVAAIWNTVDGWNGVTTADLRKAAGEQYF